MWSFATEVAQQFLLICPYYPIRYSQGPWLSLAVSNRLGRRGYYYGPSRNAKPGFWLFWVSQECKIILSSPKYVYIEKVEKVHNGHMTHVRK
jgi:hypothetical protein